jgi:hypothetical protein
MNVTFRDLAALVAMHAILQKDPERYRESPNLEILADRCFEIAGIFEKAGSWIPEGAFKLTETSD